MKKTQNQFYGKKSEMPGYLPPGSTYICTDEDALYHAREDGVPILFNFSSNQNNGEDSINSIDELFIIERDEEGNITKAISRYDVQFPPNSIEFGDSVKQGDTGQQPSYTTKFDDKKYLMMGYEIGENPIIKEMEDSSSFELQPLDDKLLVFDTPVQFYIDSRQNAMGKVYNLKIHSEEDIRLRVYREADNGGSETLLVDEVLPQETLSLDGVDFDLTPMVDFSIGKTYRLVFTSSSGIITIKGTEVFFADVYGVSRVNDTVFFPYIKRVEGWTYTEKDLTHVDYTNLRPTLLEDSSTINKLIILKEHHKKRLIVSDGSKKLEALLPDLVGIDDGWTCQIVNLTEKTIAIGGYKFKNGGSITIAYLAEENRFALIGFEANASQLDSPNILEKKDISTQAYDVLEEDDGYLINMQYGGSWIVNLPDISEVPNNFEIYIAHKDDDKSIGSIVPYSADVIDDSNLKNIYGKGFVNLKKVKISNNNFQWFVFNQVSYNTVPMQGKTRRLDFTNQDTIQLQHNLGFIPIIQVWVEDGQGGYVEANVDIDHNWDTMNFLQINLGSLQTGKVIY